LTTLTNGEIIQPDEIEYYSHHDGGSPGSSPNLKKKSGGYLLISTSQNGSPLMKAVRLSKAENLRSSNEITEYKGQRRSIIANT